MATLIVVFTVCLSLAVTTTIAPQALSEPVAADVVLSSGDESNFAQKWAKAIYDSSENYAVSNTAKEIRVRLDTDWNAVGGTFSSSDIVQYGEGPETIKAFDNGQIFVPSNAHIVLDLNGHTINRGLTAENYASLTTNGNGSVFLVNGLMEIRDDSDSEGKITGGYCYRELTGAAMTTSEDGNPSRFYWGANTSIKEGFGGGVHVRGEGAILSLYGGTITGNYAATGGGVCVDEYATLNMYGGHIDDNNVAGAGEEHGGGGVAVIFGGTVNMYEGSINDNKAAVARTNKNDGMGNWGGGVLVWGISQITSENNYYSDYSNKTELFYHRIGQTTASTFNMYGGTIDGNQASFDGGGVSVIGGGVRVPNGSGKNFYHNGNPHTEQDYTFYLGWQDPGTPNEPDGVNGDEAKRYAIFNMWGGTINGNKAQRLAGEKEQEGGTDKPLANAYPNGGAISLFLDGAFVLHNGTINNNYAEGTGGAVSLTQGGSNIFKMIGGEINGNTALAAGGGVNLSDWNDFFYMFGGEITNNSCSLQSRDGTTAATYGGGVQCAGKSTIYMSNGTDAIQIHDNYTYLPQNVIERSAYTDLFGSLNVTNAYNNKVDGTYVRVVCDVYLEDPNTITVEDSLTAQGRTTQVGVTLHKPSTHQVFTVGYGINNTTADKGDVVPSSTYFYSNNSDYPYVMNDGTGNSAQAKIVSGSDITTTATVTWQWQDKEGKWTDFIGNGDNAVSSLIDFEEGDTQRRFYNIRGLAPIDNDTVLVFAWKVTATDPHVSDGIDAKFTDKQVKNIVESGTVNFNVFEEDPSGKGDECPYVTGSDQTTAGTYIAGAGNYSFVINADRIDGIDVIICPTLVISIKQKPMEFVWDLSDEYEYNGTNIAPTAHSKDTVNGAYFNLETKTTNIRGVEFRDGAITPGDYTITVLGNAAYSNKNYIISLQSTDGASVTLVQNITVVPRRIAAAITHTKEYDGNTTLDLTNNLGEDGTEVTYFHLKYQDDKLVRDTTDGSIGVSESDKGKVYLNEDITAQYGSSAVGNYIITATKGPDIAWLGGEKASCYQILSYKDGDANRAEVMVNGEITPKHIEIEEGEVTTTKDYDGTTDAVVTKEGSVKAEQLIGDESVELDTTAAYNSANASTSTHEQTATTVTVTYTLSGANAGNYILSAVSGGSVDENGKTVTKDISGTINPCSVAVLWEDVTFTYGDDNEQKLIEYAYYNKVLDGGKQYLTVEIYNEAGAERAEFVNVGSYTAKLATDQSANLDKGNYVLRDASASKKTEMQKRQITLQLNTYANDANAEFGDCNKNRSPLGEVSAYCSRQGVNDFVNGEESYLSARVLWNNDDESGEHLYNEIYPIPGYYPIELYITDPSVAKNYDLIVTGGQFKGFENGDGANAKWGVFNVKPATIAIATPSVQSAAYEEEGVDIGVAPQQVTLKGGMTPAWNNNPICVITCTSLIFNPESDNRSESISDAHALQHITAVGSYRLTVQISAQYHETKMFVINFVISGDAVTIEFVGEFTLKQVYGSTMPDSDALIAMLDAAVGRSELTIEIHGTDSDWNEVKEQITLFVDVTGGDHTPLTGKICPVGLYSIHIEKKDGPAGYAILADAKTFDAYGTSNINRFEVVPLTAAVQWTTDEYKQGGTHNDLWKSSELGNYLGLTYQGSAFSGIWAPIVTNLVTQTMSDSVTDNVSVRYRVLRFVGEDPLTKEQIETAAAATEDEEINSLLWEITDGTMRNAGWYLIAYKEDRLYGTGSQNYTYDATSYLLINVAKAELTFNWSNTEVIYNAQAQRPNLSADILLGDDTDLLDGVALHFDSHDSVTNVGEYTVTVTLPDTIQANYNYSEPTTLFKISALSVTVEIHFADKLYDGTTVCTATVSFVDGSFSDEVKTELAQLLARFATTANFDDANAAERKKVTYTVTLSYNDGKEQLDNYKFTLGEHDFSSESNNVASEQESAATITPADVYVYGITVDEKNYDGTTDISDDLWSITDIKYQVKQNDGEWHNGLYNSDTLILVLTGEYLDKNANDGNAIVRILTMALGGASKDNYKLLFDTNNTNFYQADCDGVRSSQTRVSGCTVHKAKLTVTGGFTVEDKTYNGDDVALVKYADSEHNSINNNDTEHRYLDGVCGLDNVYVTVEARFGSANVKWQGGEVNSVVDQYVYDTDLTLNFTVGGADGNNYEMNAEQPYNGETVTAKITPRILTIGDVTVENKVYDGLTDAQINGDIILYNVVSGEESVISVTLVAQFSDANAGIGKNVTIHVEKNNDSDAKWNNYALSTADIAATATITPLPVQIKDANKADFEHTKEYDGNNIISDVTVDGYTMFFPVDTRGNVKLVATATFADANAGSGKTITVVYSLSGEGAGNYLIYLTDESPAATATETFADGEITPMSVTVNWDTEQTFTYNGTEQVAQLKLVAYYEDISGEKVYVDVTVLDSEGSSPATFKNAGDYTLKVGSGVCKDKNYQISEESAQTYTIAKAKYFIFGVTVGDKVYDGTTNVTFTSNGTVQVIGKEGTGLYDGDTITITPHGNYRDKNVGEGTCTVLITSYDIDGDGIENYERIISEADNSVVGTALAQELQVSQSAVINKTVKKKTLVVDGATFSVQNKLYDGNISAIVVYTNGTSVGFTDGNGVCLDDDVKITVDAYFGSANAGTYSSTSSDGKVLRLTFITGGDDSSNYELQTFDGEETAQITPITLTLLSNISVDNKTYDGNNNATVSAEFTNWLDDAHKNYVSIVVTGEFDDKNVGNGKQVTIFFQLQKADGCPAEFEDMWQNYTLGVESTVRNADILPIVLKIPTILADGKDYDKTTAATLHLADGEPTETLRGNITEGVLEGETVGWTATGVFDDPNAGTRNVIVTISLTGEHALNYVFDFDGAGDYDDEQDLATVEKTIADVEISKCKVQLMWEENALHTVHIYNGTQLPSNIYAFWHDVDGTKHYLDVSVYVSNESHTHDGATTVLRNAGEYDLVAPLEITDPEYSLNYELENEDDGAEAICRTLTIIQATLTVLGITILSKEYDGETTVDISTQVSGGALSGLALGDDLSFTVTNAVYDYANAGNDRTVTLTVRLDGDPTTVNNYVIEQVQVTDCVITPKQIAVEWSGLELTYTGEDLTSSVTAKWTDINGDSHDLTVSLDGKLTEGKLINADTYTAKVQQLDAGNYTLTDIEKDIVVSAAENSWITEFSLDGWTEYDDPNSPTVPQAKFQKEGEPTIEYFTDIGLSDSFESSQFAELRVGTYYVRVKVAATTNYSGLEKVYAFDIAAHEHDWQADGDPVVAPTCTTDGSQNYKCNICGATELRTIDALGHSYGTIKPQIDATCTTNGTSAHYECDRCHEKFVDDVAPDGKKQVTETDLVIEATGHTWKIDESKTDGTNTGWTWNDDYTQATLNLVCEHDDAHKLTVTVGTVKQTIAPDCEKDGSTTVTVSLNRDEIELPFAKDTFDEGVVTTLTATLTYKDGDKLGHQMGENPAWTWQLQADNTYLVTATFTCERCTHTETEQVTVESGTLTPATCTTDGKYVYSATVQYNEKPYTDQFEINVPATGHNWKTHWSWSGAVPTLTVSCDNCDEQFEVSVSAQKSTELSTPANCTTEGTDVYTATVTEQVIIAASDGKMTDLDAKDLQLTSQNSVKGEDATGHDWIVDTSVDENGWLWSVDSVKNTYTAQLHIKCDVCDVTVTIDGEVTSQNHPATCTADGYTLYTATAKFVEGYSLSAEQLTDTYTSTNEGSMLGHKWKVTWDAWNDDYSQITAHLSCENGCGTTETVTATSDADSDDKITAETTEPQCWHNRYNTYTASVTFDASGEEVFTHVSDPIEEAQTRLPHTFVPTEGHSYLENDGWEVFDDGNGNITAVLYFKCSVCSEEHSIAATVNMTGYVEGNEPTCTATGKANYTATVKLDEEYESVEYSGLTTTIDFEGSVAALEHNYQGNPVWNYQIVEGELTVTATFECANHCGTPLVITATRQASLDDDPAEGEAKFASVDSDPDCTTPGLYTIQAKVTNNGVTYTADRYTMQSEAALGHQWGKYVSVIEGGVHKHYQQCSKCEATNTPVDCTVTKGATVAPTCDKQGYTEYSCPICNAAWQDDYQDATGHNWQVDASVNGNGWTWQDDHTGATLTLVCTNDNCPRHGEQMVLTAVISHVTTPATCQAAGQTVYTATVTLPDGAVGISNTDAQTVDIAQLDHIWSSWTQVAGKDQHEQHCTRECCVQPDGTYVEGAQRVVDCQMTVISETLATCAQEGSSVSRCATCGNTHTDTLSKLSHSFTRYEHSVTAEGKHQHTSYCVNCGAEGETTDCTLAESTHAATCTEVGYKQRACDTCGYSEITSYLPPLGHDWSELEAWMWSAEGFTCTVTLKCDRCSESHTVNATVTSELTVAPTCNTQGTRTYTARYGEWVNHETKTETLDFDTENGHSWQLDSWNWTGNDVSGYTKAEAVFKCERCGETHTVTAELSSESVGTGTCTNPDRSDYVAVVEITNGATTTRYTDFKATRGEVKEHVWLSNPTFQWADDFSTATVTFSCSVCHETKTVSAVVLSEEHNATCTEGGYIVYTAFVTESGTYYTETKTVQLGESDPDAHVWGEWKREEPDCTTAGRLYRECTKCGSVEEQTLAPLGHNWSEWTTDEGGTTESRHCRRCDATETRPASSVDHTHVWSEPVWTWSDDHSSATATFTCLICGHKETVEATVTIEVKDDVTQYTANVEYNGETYTILVDIANPQPEVDYGDFGPGVVYIIAQVLIMIVAAIVLNRKNKKK